jgi:hypothetical protein
LAWEFDYLQGAKPAEKLMPESTRVGTLPGAGWSGGGLLEFALYARKNRTYRNFSGFAFVIALKFVGCD